VRINDVVGGTSEAGIEAAQEVEDELQVGDGVADIAERIGGGLHPLGVVVDGRIALGHGVELMTQEVALYGDPELACSLVRRRSKAEDVRSSGAKELAANAGVRDGPSRVSGIGLRRGIHVQEKTKFPAEGGEERLPLVEVELGQFQGHREMVFDRYRCIGGDEDGRGSGGACGGHGARRLAGAGGRGGRHGDLGGERSGRGRETWEEIGLDVGGEEKGPRSLIPCRESPRTLCGWGAFYICSQ